MASSCEPEESDLITLEEVNMWNVDALKEFCRKRGYKVSGSKAELAARCYFLYNSRQPEIPGAKEREASIKKNYTDILKFKYPSPDPHKIQESRWINEEDGMKFWPPLNCVDIDWFFKQHNQGGGLTRAGLTAYKTGKAFSYYSCDWLRRIYYTSISKTHACCYVKSQCTPSNRLNDPPHQLWAKMMKETGEIISAYCSCVAGLSQTCNHVAALLFKVEAACKLGLSNPACTSKACSWTEPSLAKFKSGLNMRMEDINFTKPDHKKGKTASVISGQLKRLHDVRESLTEDTDPTFYREFIADLRQTLPNASLFLPGRANTAGKTTAIPLPSNVMAAAEKSSSSEQLISELTLTQDEREEIERSTHGQSKNDLWVAMRKGRITASNFYRVHTKMESIKQDRAGSENCDSLLKSLINPPSLSHLPQIQKGIHGEAKAIEDFLSFLANDHEDLSVAECGLFIHPTLPYLGASPDGIVTCKCCPPKLLEIKCPSLAIESLNYLDEDYKLKLNTKYYGQIQGQMAVTNYSSTYFCVYTPSTSIIKEYALNASFCGIMLPNLEQFFKQFMVPALISPDMSEPSKKKVKK